MRIRMILALLAALLVVGPVGAGVGYGPQSCTWGQLCGGGTPVASTSAWEECIEKDADDGCILAAGTYDLGAETLSLTLPNVLAGVKEIACEPGTIITSSGDPTVLITGQSS
jgi:hypothetical protein